MNRAKRNNTFSRLLPRAALLLLGAAAAGLLAPEIAAGGLVSLALVAGYFWRHIRWWAIVIFAGGLLGLAARHSAGEQARFSSNLQAMGAIAITMVGLGVMARGAGRGR